MVISFGSELFSLASVFDLLRSFGIGSTSFIRGFGIEASSCLDMNKIRLKQVKNTLISTKWNQDFILFYVAKKTAKEHNSNGIYYIFMCIDVFRPSQKLIFRYVCAFICAFHFFSIATKHFVYRGCTMKNSCKTLWNNKQKAPTPSVEIMLYAQNVGVFEFLIPYLQAPEGHNIDMA